MMEITPDQAGTTVALNTATAKLFGRVLPEVHRIIDTIRVGASMPIEEAATELQRWYI